MSNDPKAFAVMAGEMIDLVGAHQDKTGWTPPSHRHRRRLDLWEMVRDRPEQAARRFQRADGRGLCPALLGGDQGGSGEARLAAAETAARAGPLALRPGRRRRRHGRRGEAGRHQEVGQSRPVDQPPLLGGGARLVLSLRAGRECRRGERRDGRSRRPALQFRRGRPAPQDAGAEARRLCRLPRCRRLHRILRRALQRAAPAGERAGRRRPRRGHHRARAAQGHRGPLPGAAAPARRRPSPRAAEFGQALTR